MTYIWISKPDFNGKDSASVLNACIDWQIGDILQWSSNYLYAIQISQLVTGIATILTKFVKQWKIKLNE